MTFKRAIVTAVGPLRIKIDGDTVPIPFTPKSGIDPATLAVGDVVHADQSGHRLLVLVRVGGVPGYNDLSLVAGAPAGVLESPGTLGLTGFGTMGDRTLYVVVDIYDRDSNYSAFARLSASGTASRILFGTRGSSSSSLSTRFDTDGGSSNVVIQESVRDAGARVIGWASASEGITVASSGFNDAVGSSSSMTPGDGMSDTPGLELFSGTSSELARIVVAYKGAHDETTRRRVMTWLASRYGVSPPT